MINATNRVFLPIYKNTNHKKLNQRKTNLAKSVFHKNGVNIINQRNMARFFGKLFQRSFLNAHVLGTPLDTRALSKGMQEIDHTASG